MSRSSFAPGPACGFPANGKGLMFAPVLWLVYFIAVYSIQGAGCAAGLDTAEVHGASVLRIVLAALTVCVAAVQFAAGVWTFVIWRRLRPRGEEAGGDGISQSTFFVYGALLHAAMFFLATVWIGIPVLMTDLCSASR